MTGFYVSSNEIIEKIRKRTFELLADIEEIKIKDILMQRAKSSSFIKGVLAYHLHGGLGGNFDDFKKIDLSSKLEIFCSSGAILDNVIDMHEERNGETTYLKEYGSNIQLFASQYALNYGLKNLLPFLDIFCKNFPDKYKLDQTLLGMIKMDLSKSINLEDHLKVIGSVNGTFNEVILIMAASVATQDNQKIESVGKYGFNLGVGLGIYEELRDLLGEHGRRRATEVEEGRIITPLHLATGFDYSYYIGRELSEKDYNTLLYKLQKSGALEMTKNIVTNYFTKAINHIKSAVDMDCIKKIKPLQKSVEDSMNCMLVKNDF